MIPADGPGYGELVAELADMRRHLAASEDMRTLLIKTLDARTAELSESRLVNRVITARLRGLCGDYDAASALTAEALAALKAMLVMPDKSSRNIARSIILRAEGNRANTQIYTPALLSAAPDMLPALKWVANLNDARGSSLPTDCMSAVYDAIAKADGRHEGEPV